MKNSGLLTLGVEFRFLMSIVAVVGVVIIIFGASAATGKIAEIIHVGINFLLSTYLLSWHKGRL